MTYWGSIYRSDIAHGNIVDFEKKYKILKSTENVNSFLSEIIKNVILLAIEKPEFLSDLKKC